MNNKRHHEQQTSYFCLHLILKHGILKEKWCRQSRCSRFGEGVSLPRVFRGAIPPPRTLLHFTTSCHWRQLQSLGSASPQRMK